MTGFSHQTFLCTEGYDFQFQSNNGEQNNGSLHMSHIKLQPFDVTNGQFSFKGKVLNAYQHFNITILIDMILKCASILIIYV